MTGKIVAYAGAALVWLLGFIAVAFASYNGAHLNVAHAIIVGNLAGCLWFLLASAINISKARATHNPTNPEKQ